MSDTIAAISTGALVSAIGIVRLSGDDAINISEKLFVPYNSKPLSTQPDRKLVYGKLHSTEGDVLDICLCTVSHAPNSYTGENTAEFQCHGSPVLLRTLLDELFKLGARQAGPGEFTKRAFLNNRMDLTSAEAVIDLIDAENVESIRNAAGQLSGAISVKIDKIYSDLTDISSHYHAVLDYPDEDIEDFEMESYTGTLTNACETLERLLATVERGKIMSSGIPAAIIGLPNAGKSSLLNALLGYERAIVTAVPGTTRDTIEEKVKIGRLSLRLIDTAGIHETDDIVEKMGVERSLKAMESAALVIAVIDGSGDSEGTREIVAQAEKAEKAIVVVSKKDLGISFRPETKLPCVDISAVTGEGIDALENAIAAMFPFPQVPAGEILTNTRQADAVRRALEYLRAALDAMNAYMTPDIVLTETEGAMSVLGELTGKTVREDITNRIFARFCVGK